MIDSYPLRVRENILPLSVASTLPEAFEEWKFDDVTIDHEEPVETCRLCDQRHVRYHFRIRNRITHRTLMVGSHCILQFGVYVFDGDTLLSPKDAQRKLERLKDAMRLESCLKALGRLAEEENNQILKGALDYYRKNKVLTPRQASVAFWRLEANGIDHSPSFFRITLKRVRQKNDLQAMKQRDLLRLWPALSSSQRQIALGLGHQPPEEIS